MTRNEHVGQVDYEKDLKVVRAFPTIIAVLFPSDFRVFRGHSFCINLT